MFVLSAASRAAAQSPSAADAARAEALFREAREATHRGDHAVACARFAESQALDPAAGTLLNLGDCEEKRGNLPAAWTAFREAQGMLAASDTRASYALKRAAALEPKIARLTVVIAPAASKDALLFRDGARAPSDGRSPVALEPGKHLIVLRSPGHLDTKLEISLREGEARTIELPEGPEEAKAAPRVDPSESRASAPAASRADAPVTHLDPLVVGAFGVGAAGLLVGLMSGIMVLDAKASYRSHCSDGYCDSEGSSAASRGTALGVVSPVAFALGAAGIGFGAYRLSIARASASVGPTGVSVQGAF
jgi:hypothetical protein